jgi:hypothetical protein
VSGKELEPSGAYEKAKEAITFTHKELSLLALSLDANASPSEQDVAATMFVRSLRNRGLTGSQFEVLRSEPEVTLIVHSDRVTVHHRGAHELLTTYVLDQLLGVQGTELMENLRQSFIRQSVVVAGRV